MNYYILDTGILLGYMRSAPYAKASLLKATLITTDKDFLPLDNVFLNVEYISPK